MVYKISLVLLMHDIHQIKKLGVKTMCHLFVNLVNGLIYWQSNSSKRLDHFETLISNKKVELLFTILLNLVLISV
jgi:hypothetical protein